MDEISILRDTFDTDTAPSPAAQQRARAALQGRIDGVATSARRRQWRLRIPIGIGVVTAAAVVGAFAVADQGVVAPTRPDVQESVPYLRPVSAVQYLENAAWFAERERWVEPRKDQFMYVETREMRNPQGYEQQHPNGALVPGKAEYRTIQSWNRIDGQVQASIRNGRLEVQRQGDNNSSWAHLDWSEISGMTTPAKVRAFVEHPRGPVSMDPDALIGQYVLPPAVRAAVFRYLAQQPGMRLNPDAVNIDGRAAIGLGRVEEGYLAQELLFDKQTYRLIGERLIAVADHTNRADDGTTYTHKGDLLRQVIYARQGIVDEPGDTA